MFGNWRACTPTSLITAGHLTGTSHNTSSRLLSSKGDTDYFLTCCSELVGSMPTRTFLLEPIRHPAELTVFKQSYPSGTIPTLIFKSKCRGKIPSEGTVLLFSSWYLTAKYNSFPSSLRSTVQVWILLFFAVLSQCQEGTNAGEKFFMYFKFLKSFPLYTDKNFCMECTFQS